MRLKRHISPENQKPLINNFFNSPIKKETNLNNSNYKAFIFNDKNMSKNHTTKFNCFNNNINYYEEIKKAFNFITFILKQKDAEIKRLKYKVKDLQKQLDDINEKNLMTFNNEKINEILLNDDQSYCLDIGNTDSNINKKNKKKIMINRLQSSNFNNLMKNFFSSSPKPNANGNIFSLSLQDNSGIYNNNNNFSRNKDINFEKKIKIIHKKKSLNKNKINNYKNITEIYNKTLDNNNNSYNNKYKNNQNTNITINMNDYINNNITNRIRKNYHINKNNIKTKIMEYKNFPNESNNFEKKETKKINDLDIFEFNNKRINSNNNILKMNDKVDLTRSKNKTNNFIKEENKLNQNENKKIYKSNLEFNK